MRCNRREGPVQGELCRAVAPCDAKLGLPEGGVGAQDWKYNDNRARRLPADASLDTSPAAA